MIDHTWRTSLEPLILARHGMDAARVRGQPLILHEGRPPGYSSVVALLPDSELGIVVLANQNASLLGGLAVNLVPNILLGDAPAAPQAVREAGGLSPYLGRYLANFGTFSNEVFTAQAGESGLALDIPSQRLFALNAPDAQGRWQFGLTDQIAVSFRRNGAGEVVALNLHQQGMTFEALREGVKEQPEIDLAQLQKYLGSYQSDTGLDITTFVQNQRLAIRIRGATVFDLRPPDAEGRWATRANPEIAVAFDESETGEVTGLRFFRPGGQPVLTLAAAPRDTRALPTVEELLAFGSGGQQNRQSAARTLRTTGTVRFPQSAVTGRFQIVSAGDDQWRTDIDLGSLGNMRVVLNGDGGWREAFGWDSLELRGELLEQMRLMLSGAWRRHEDSLNVLRQEELDGRPVYVVELRKEGLPAITLRIDTETGDLVALATTLVLPGLGALPTTTRFEDYRVIDGVRLPFRHLESNQQNGRTVYEVERVEFDVELDDELFILRPDEPRPER